MFCSKCVLKHTEMKHELRDCTILASEGQTVKKSAFDNLVDAVKVL